MKPAASTRARRSSPVRGSRRASSSGAPARKKTKKRVSTRRATPRFVGTLLSFFRNAAVLAVAVIAVLAWQYYEPAKVSFETARYLETLEAEQASLQRQNEATRERNEFLLTPEGVETMARETLGLVKKGEHQVVVVPTEDATVGVEADATKQSVNAGMTGGWLDRVLGAVSLFDAR